jgi:sec-independent protein translocase protein TatC
MSEENGAGEGAEEGRMSLLEHLIELRRRLMWSVVAFVICFFISYYFADQVFNFLVQPLADLWAAEGQHRRLIFTAMQEKFFTDLKIGFFVAAFISFPVVSNQVWLFVAPGLYANEKKAFLPFLIATPILFFLGGAFVYYFVLPVAWNFFASFEQAAEAGPLAIELEPKVDQYLSLVMQLIFAFGLCFELPVVLTLLTKIGFTSVAGLRKNRRYAIVIAFVVAAVLTPPDPISQLGLAIPIILLYEISILCSRLVEGKQRKEAEEDEEAAT